MQRRVFLILTGLIGLSGLLAAAGPPPLQPKAASLAERLGYAPDARLLIVHADDLGLANSVNQATFEALRKGRITSASVMVPCPWVLQAATEVGSQPDWDIGIHLTMNAEWERYKWGPVAPADRVASLLDPRGFLPATVWESIEGLDVREAEIEIRAQIERARKLGIEPTHLDSHMGTLFRSPELLATTLEIAREYKLPFLLPRNLLAPAAFARELITDTDVLIDSLAMLTSGVEPGDWPDAYGGIIRELKPGVTQLIVHVGYDDPELQAVTVNHPDFGAAWRQRDLDYLLSDDFARLLEQEDIKLVTWREIGKLLR